MAKETSFTHDADTIDAIQGLEGTADDPVRLEAAIAHAVHYRGDVSITLRQSGETIEGFVFDRTEPKDGEGSALRLIPRDGDQRLRVACDDIQRLVLSGRDTAAGRSFETWVKKYVERKQAGLSANIESEDLGE